MDWQEEWAGLCARILSLGCGPGLGPVPGDGDPKGEIVLVAEAPGETEARKGRPFVGAAGRLLEDALGEAGLARERIWITNTVKCRPVQGEPGHWRNRAPTAAEIRAWQPLLEEELRLVAPRVIVCLGAVAAKVVIDPQFGMQRQRGQWYPTRFQAEALATYHPAYVFRLTGEARDAALTALGTDLSAARRKLEEGEGI
jgi:uracil-DNA glycosylase family 4